MRFGVGRWARGLLGLIRHGGLIGIHGSAQVLIKGDFLFGKQVSIGRNSLIQVSENASLKLGTGVRIGREAELSPSGSIVIGDFTSIQDRCIILGEVSIGANCLLAPNIMISSATHEFMERPTWLIRDQEKLIGDVNFEPASPRHLAILVGEDCWIGINSVVMRGVTIGRGCVIGANSVVTRSTAPYSIVAGAPAKMVGERFKFSPPREIAAGNPGDLPYFYSGFDLRQSVVSGSPGRLRTSGRFQVAIDCNKSKRICIEIETDLPIILRYSSQLRPLGSGNHTVAFSLEPASSDWLISLEARNLGGDLHSVSIVRVRAEA